MAYNNGYNPDALPAHAEPEQVPDTDLAKSMATLIPCADSDTAQAAQILSTQQQNRHDAGPASNQRPPTAPNSYTYNQQPPQNKPLPPVQQPIQQLNPQYASRPPQPSQSANQYKYSGSPPPPQNYGFGPPPQHHARSPPLSRPPQTPAPQNQSNQDASLFPLFKAVDRSGT
ncbi:MAG: hypothetical protein Q9183_002790, partial [Haloplaca sp. 2 TL-2023]